MDGETDDTGELGLEELAQRSGVTPRTIRFYQSQGLLPKPRKDGRDARYNQDHLGRLRMIAELQEHDLKLEAIRQLVALEAKGARSVADWLGLDEALRNPWVDDRSETMTLAEVHTRLGARPRRLVGSLVDAGVLVREADGRFQAPSEALFDIALRMLDAGTSVDVAARAADLLRSRLAKAADELVALFEAETGKGFAGRGRPEEVAKALDALRPVAIDAAGFMFAQEIERALRELAASGPRLVTRR